MVMKQLFDKFEPQDIVSLINMNQLKQCIGLQTPESIPQSLFEQMAALENQFKKRTDDLQVRLNGIRIWSMTSLSKWVAPSALPL